MPGTSRRTGRLPATGSWQLGEILVEVVVPANTSAAVWLPGKTQEAALEVGSGKHVWRYAYSHIEAKRAP